MSKIIGYMVCEANSSSKLEESVRTYVRRGWEPVGGVSVCQHHSTMYGIIYAQALVMRDVDSKEKEGK